MEPGSPPPAEIGEDIVGAFGAQMQVRRLPAHRMQQPGFVLLARKCRKIDFGAVRRQSPDNPFALQPNERVDGSDRGVERLLVANLLRFTVLFQ